jgi:hypothetical protein
MEPQRWAVIESLYERALELDPAERLAWLQKACNGDASLLEEIESLLACADAHLSNPAVRPQMGMLWDQMVRDFDVDSDTSKAA